MDAHNLIIMYHATWKDKRPLITGRRSNRGSRAHRKLPAEIRAWMLFLHLLTLSLISHSAAAESSILFVKSGPASVYNEIINTARQHIEEICQSKDTRCIEPSISVASTGNADELLRRTRDHKWDLIITIGSNAAKLINSYHISTAILYSLIPSHSYPAIRSTSASRHKSAIYIDQPIKRQLQLIKSALPERKRVGVLLGHYSGISKTRLQKIMHDMGLTPVILEIAPDDIGSSLDDIYGRVDVLLAQPDPSIYNRKTVMTVLLSSYRHNVPVFGYSAAFVRSGATVAIYSSPSDIGRHIGDEIGKYFSSHNRTLPPPSYPKYFSINTNRSVVRSLNITIPSPASLKTRMVKAR